LELREKKFYAVSDLKFPWSYGKKSFMPYIFLELFYTFYFLGKNFILFIFHKKILEKILYFLFSWKKILLKILKELYKNLGKILDFYFFIENKMRLLAPCGAFACGAPT